MKGDKELRAFDADGIEHQFTPEFHVSNYILCMISSNDYAFQFDSSGTQLTQFFDRIEETYRGGKPLHIVAPEDSLFDVIPYLDFQALSPSQIQDRLRHKNVIVTGCPHSNMKFDEAGLRTLCPLDNIVSIQGMNLNLLAY